MKIIEIKYCSNRCEYFNCQYVKGNLYRYRCFNPLARRKNGNFRILNHKMLLRHGLPKWCPLENYKSGSGYL